MPTYAYRFRKAMRTERDWILSLALSYVQRTYPHIQQGKELYGDFTAFVNETESQGKKRPVGGLLIRFDATDRTGEIHAVCDSRLFRDHHARTAFMEFLDYLRDRGVRTWITTVRADNLDVIDALEFCGFRQDVSQGQTQFLSYSREA